MSTEEPHGAMERLSDLIGSVRGIWLLATVELVYMAAATVAKFDPFPFAFLTLVLSLIALQFSQIIIVVQNRQGAAARDEEQRAFALLVDLHDKLLPEDDPHAVVDVPEKVIELRNTEAD